MKAIGIALMVVMTLPAADGRAQAQPAQEKLTSLAGAWTINTHPAASQPHAPEGRGDGRDGGGRGASRRPGGFGGGPLGGGPGGLSGRGNREQIARQRDALRDITDPPDHLIVTVTESMVILTGPDGRATRLAPDGKKIKDENTKIERKTRWIAGKLVSEIDGLGQKITQTFSVDAEPRQLRVVVEMEADRYNDARTITHVYDADTR
jgi:hypothetical protein